MARNAKALVRAEVDSNGGIVDLPRAISVVWEDHSDASSGWEHIDAVSYASKELFVVFTLGWLIEETKDYLIVAHSFCPDGALRAAIKILKSCVLHRVDLSKSSLSRTRRVVKLGHQALKGAGRRSSRSGNSRKEKRSS